MPDAGWRRTAATTPMALTAAAGVLVLAFFAIAGPILWGGAAADINADAILQGSSAAHLLGTDELGRDLLARTFAATRLSLQLAVSSALLAAAMGIVLGAAPVVLGRLVARLLGAVINLLLAFPGILLSMFFAIIIGVGQTGALWALALAYAPFFARLTQTLAASIGRAEYLDAARLLGVGRLRLLARHVLPNIAEPLVLNVALVVGEMLLSFAGLSFLGLGVQPPDYDWGGLLNSNLNRIDVSPAAALGPGVAIVVAALTFNLLGELVARHSGHRPLRASGRWRRTPAALPTAPESEPAGQPVLDAAGLTVALPTADGPITPVRGVDLRIEPGEIVGVVGESGSGKTLTALALAGLIDPPGQVQADRLRFLGRGLQPATGRDTRRRLGTGMALIYQNPGSSLNPVLRIGRQLAEVPRVHERLTRPAADQRALDRLRQVAIGAAETRRRQFPHQWSGGMKQRAMIAMGLMGQPRLLIADEPTTALDVTVQRQILALLRQVNAETGAAVLLISHDIVVVGELCHRLVVMYAGRIVEALDLDRLRAGRAAHPYTRALLAAVPDMDLDRTRPLSTIPGRQPDPAAVPTGCPFAPRCAHADAQCQQRPELVGAAGQLVACWHPQGDA